MGMQPHSFAGIGREGNKKSMAAEDVQRNGLSEAHSIC